MILLLLLLFIILESKKKVEKKNFRGCWVPPKVSIIKVKYKTFGGNPTPPTSLFTISYTAYTPYNLFTISYTAYTFFTVSQ